MKGGKYLEKEKYLVFQGGEGQRSQMRKLFGQQRTRRMEKEKEENLLEKENVAMDGRMIERQGGRIVKIELKF